MGSNTRQTSLMMNTGINIAPVDNDLKIKMNHHLCLFHVLLLKKIEKKTMLCLSFWSIYDYTSVGMVTYQKKFHSEQRESNWRFFIQQLKKHIVTK